MCLAPYNFDFLTLGTGVLPAGTYHTRASLPFSLGWLWCLLVEIIRQSQNTEEKGKNPHTLLGSSLCCIKL